MDKNEILMQEEVRALKLFLSLFYIIFFTFEIAAHSILPMMNSSYSTIGFPKEGLGGWLYILLIVLMIIGVYLIKIDKPYVVKYVIFIGFSVLDFFNNMLIYYGTNKEFNSGNMVEVFLILYSPFFMNQRYFWWVNIGMIVKYMMVGLVLKTTVVMNPILICFIMSFICWILFVRFQSYIKTIEKIYIKVKQTEKLALIGKMATVIVHEIRNPLTALKGFTKLQAEKYPEDNAYHNVMTQEIERMNEIVSELMLFGKPKPREYQLHSIEEIISYVTRVVEQAAAEQKITFKMEFDKSLPKVYCDERQMKQVFLNLLRNAIEAMPNGGDIVISGAISKDMMNIYVKDTGCGIIESEIPKIGEAFYTTKESGTGLGLMVTYKIIEEHEGTIQFMSNVGEGTTVELSLPIT
ncbi:ATP-binding protein [Bacillus manliponensis]|uniref:ATP-binding protein n=1 Tax=Bacillus manliponensis TaxID=574376 RepID=UPI0035173C25